jgi:hypothetical protein
MKTNDPRTSAVSPDGGWDLYYHNDGDVKGLLVDPALRRISEVTIDTETSLDEQLHQLIGADFLAPRESLKRP